jgi:hypothetical protein
VILSVINLSFTGSGITTGFGGSTAMGAAVFRINGLKTLPPILKGAEPTKGTA